MNEGIPIGGSSVGRKIFRGLLGSLLKQHSLKPVNYLI